MYGFELKSGRVNSRKIVIVDMDDVTGVEEMDSVEAKQVIKATNELPLFTNNIDSTGYPDTQCALEEYCRLLAEGSITARIAFFMRNQLLSSMRRVHKKYTGVSLIHKEKVESWEKYFARLAEWEAHYSQLADTKETSPKTKLQLPSHAKKTNAEFFAEACNDMSTLVKWYAPYSGNLQESPRLVPMPRKKKTKSSEKTESKKQKIIEEPLEREWHVNGISKTRWTLGDWTLMSMLEKDEYRTRRAQRGVWPQEIPLNERYIDDEGA